MAIKATASYKPLTIFSMLSTEQLLQNAEQFYDADKYKEVINLLSDELLEERKSAELYAQRAMAYGKSHELDRQWKDCETALMYNPSYHKTYGCMGNYWFDKNEYDKAISDFDRALQLKPDYARGFNGRGIALNKLNRHGEAIESYSRAIEFSSEPNNILAIFYYNRGLARNYIESFDIAIKDFDTAIELKPDYSHAFITRGNAWSGKKKYEKSIEDYTRAIELDPGDWMPYYNRGNDWIKKNEFDKAIQDFDSSIELNPDESDIFIVRGNALGKKLEFDKAIQNFDRALELKPNDEDSFLNRGWAFYRKRDYPKAIADFDKAISLKPDFALAFNNRGVARKDTNDLENAIQDLLTSSEIDPNLEYPYYNLGDIAYEKNDYKKALGYYEKYLALTNDSASIIKSRVTTIKARLDEEIETELDNATWFITDIIQNITNEEKKKTIRKKSLDVLDYMDKIRNHAHISNPEPVVHYTKLTVAEIFITKIESNLRFYNVLYMNDPEEGKVIFEYLDMNPLNGNNSIKKSFEIGRLMPDGDNNVYLGSFLPASDDISNIKFSHEDELVLWRTYGKNETGEEAKGCSIVFDNEYFSNESHYMQGISGKMSELEKKIVEEEALLNTERHPLYRVLYLNKRTGKIINTNGVNNDTVNADLEKLRAALCSLIDEGTNTKEEIIVCQIVYRILSELRYFFKSSDYSYENECRVIIYANSENKQVTIDEATASPKKLYYAAEAKIQPHIRRIYIGPRVPNADAWKMYLDVTIQKNKGKPEYKYLLYDIQVLKSTTKFQ